MPNWDWVGMPQDAVCCHIMTGGPRFPVFVFYVLGPCVSLWYLFVIGAGACVYAVFYGGAAVLRGVAHLGVGCEGSYAPLGVAREHTYFFGVGG